MTSLPSSANLATTSTTAPRVWEIDALKGIAIILVVFYHFVWDLSYFHIHPVNAMSPSWQTFARSAGSTFIFLLGLSLSYNHIRTSEHYGRGVQFSEYLRRGSRIFRLGLFITLATYFVLGQGFVVFGILHLLGLAIVLAYPFLCANRWVSLIAGLLLIGVGLYLNTLAASHPYLIWLGVKQQGRVMVDYYPLLPWFGITLLGIFVGRMLYPPGVSRTRLPDCSEELPIRGLCLLGQHTFAIYFFHQPILMGLIMTLIFLVA